MVKVMLKQIAVSFAVTVLLSGGSFAQTTAMVDPSVATPLAAASVFDPCKTVSENPAIADAKSGICVTAAVNLVGSLEGMSPADADQLIADTVALIAPLPTEQANAACDGFDEEIAAAVRILAARASTPDQVAAINEIANTIASCTPGETAAITPATPA